MSTTRIKIKKKKQIEQSIPFDINPIKTNNNIIAYLRINSPYVFKKLSFICKALSTKQLMIEFTTKATIISMLSHTRKSETVIIINPDNLKNCWYDCKQRSTVFISNSEFESIFSKVDNNYKSLEIKYEKYFENQRIFISLETYTNLIENYNVELTQDTTNYNKFGIFNKIEEEKYDNKCDIQSKILKRAIISIKPVSNKFTFNVTKNKNVLLKSISNNKKISLEVIMPCQPDIKSESINKISTRDIKNISILSNCCTNVFWYNTKNISYIKMTLDYINIYFCIKETET